MAWWLTDTGAPPLGLRLSDEEPRWRCPFWPSGKRWPVFGERSDFSGIPFRPLTTLNSKLERAGYSGNRSHRAQGACGVDGDRWPNNKVRFGEGKTTALNGKSMPWPGSTAGDADVIMPSLFAPQPSFPLIASDVCCQRSLGHDDCCPGRSGLQCCLCQGWGRVHRTGQVALPAYTLLMGDLPAEKRPGAILCRKMASLNANTTARTGRPISL